MSESGIGGFINRAEFDRDLTPEETVQAVAGYLKARDMVGVRKGLRMVKNVQPDEYYLKLAKDFVEMNNTASKDALTGLFTRGALDKYLKNEVADRNKSGDTTPFTLVFVDADDFGSINKEEPDLHKAGNRTLAMLGTVIQAKIAEVEKKYGVSGEGFRYGGEEIVLAFEGSEDVVVRVVEELGKQLKEQGAKLSGLTKRSKLTISAGISVFNLGDTAEVLVARAMVLENQVKKSGKNGMGRYESGRVKIEKF